MADEPPNQLSIDSLDTTTPNLADLYIYRNNVYIHMADCPPSHLSIDVLNTATPNLAHLMAEQCTYSYGRWTPSQLSIDTLNTATPNLADLYI